MAATAPRPWRATISPHTAVAAWVLGAAALTFVGLDLLARSERLALAMTALRLEHQQQSRGYYEHQRLFTDAEDRLVLELLPRSDYSRGGVVFLGSSNMKTGMPVWTLPPEQRRLIHNYGIGATNNTATDQFVRHLVEDRQLLAAGAEKTLLVFGLSYHLNAHRIADGYFPGLWRRHGLYDYSASRGIAARRMSRLESHLRIENARIYGFLQHVPDYFRLRYRLRAGAGPIPRRIHDPAVYVERWRRYMGPGWRDQVGFQLAELSSTLAYLRERNAHLAVVLLPLGSWENRLPFDRFFTPSLTDLCRSYAVPVHDLRDLLEDEEFADSVHTNLDGMAKLKRPLMRIALHHLYTTGALPRQRGRGSSGLPDRRQGEPRLRSASAARARPPGRVSPSTNRAGGMLHASASSR